MIRKYIRILRQLLVNQYAIMQTLQSMNENPDAFLHGRVDETYKMIQEVDNAL